MADHAKTRSEKAGLPPGTLVHVGEAHTHDVRITVMDYDSASFTERQVGTAEECFPYLDSPSITWVNMDGIHRVDLIEKLGTKFGIDPLTLEDIVNTSQRPKLDEYPGYLFVSLKMIRFDEARSRPIVEQMSLVLGSNFVISFQETAGDVFDPVRERLRNHKGRIRDMGADYLAYRLLDTLVDHYFVVLEHIGEQIEKLELRVLDRNLDTNSVPREIHRLRTDLMALRKATWPLRELMGYLSRGGIGFIKKNVTPYLHDVYDHTVQVVDTIETFREVIGDLHDIHLSNMNYRANEVMKVLTIIATIFIPLSFIASVYGMNFKYMPELGSKWGYPGVWLIMIGIAGGLLAYFRKKQWL